LNLLFLGRTLKAMVFFFLDFSKAPKVVVFFLVFKKVPWPWSSCATFSYWSTCPLSYLAPLLFVVMRSSSSPPFTPPCFLL
jgi:hypothetical protein